MPMVLLPSPDPLTQLLNIISLGVSIFTWVLLSLESQLMSTTMTILHKYCFFLIRSSRSLLNLHAETEFNELKNMVDKYFTPMCTQGHSVENSTYRFKISILSISLDCFSWQQKAFDYKAPTSEQWPSAEPVWAWCLPPSRQAVLDGEQLLSSALTGTCLSPELLAVSANPFHQFQFSLGYFPISTEIYFQTL